MKVRQGPRHALLLATLLLALLSFLLASLTGQRTSASTTLYRLTPQGMLAKSMEGDEAQAYERLLLQGFSTSWFQRLWHRLRTYGTIRHSHLQAKSGDLQAARRHLVAHLERYPQDLQARWRLLEVATSQQDHDLATETASVLLSQRPGFGPALLRRAHARQLLGRHLGSLHDFMAAVERPLLAKDFTAAAQGLLQLLVDRGEAEAARRYARKLRHAVSLPRSELLLGYAAHALGEYEVAAQHFHAVLEAEAIPTPTLLLALARALSQSDKAAEALDLLLGQHFQGREEQTRQRMVSRLADRLGREELAIEAAEAVLETSEDHDLRLEQAQRLLDLRPRARAAAERAWLLLSDGSQKPCTNALAEGARCRRLAAEALWRLDRHQDLLALLRTSLPDSSIDFLARLGLTLLETDPTEGAFIFASLATLGEGAASARYRLQAAEAFLAAGQGHSTLNLLEGKNEPETLEVRIYAAQQARDWKQLRDLLEASPSAKDGLPLEDGHARSYCDALAVLASPDLAACLERLAERFPLDADLHYRLASLHREALDLQPALRWLQKARQVRADAAWLLEEGFLLSRLERTLEAEEAFRAAQNAGAGAEAELALAYSLAARGRRGAAAYHLRQALAQAELPSQRRLPALDLLGQLLQEAARPDRAADVLQQALHLEDSPERRLRLAQALQQAGETAAAEASLHEVDRSLLDPAALLLWYDLAAELAEGSEKIEAAVQLRQAAAALGPTSARHELLAKALLRRNGTTDHEAARGHLAVAIALTAEPSPVLLAQLAELDREAGHLPRAEMLLREAVQKAPHVHEYREGLAQLLAIQGEQAEAVPLLRAALEAASDHPHATQAYRQERVAQLQAQHRASTRRWRLQWHEVFCLGEEKDCVRPSLTSAGNSVGQGQAEIGFAPLVSQHFGLVELTLRANWDRAPSKFPPRSRYLQGAFGFRYKPLHEDDFWLGAERLQALGSHGRSDWRLFATYGWSRGREWTFGSHGPRPFFSLYAELNRLLGGDREQSAATDLQVGLRGQSSKSFAYSPFLYLSSGREEARNLAFWRTEIGLGLSTDWRFGEDLYDGYLASGNLTLRLGHERDTRGQGATRGTLALGLRY
jgi:tetratricopeptide (TPR) repeat protein